MWFDALKSVLDDEPVIVRRSLDFPCDVGHLEITFPDGSVINMGINAEAVVARLLADASKDQGALADAWDQSSAGRWYGRLLHDLYERATAKKMDVDAHETPSGDMVPAERPPVWESQ